MATLVKSNGGNFTPAPADVHNAVCIGVYDLGTQQTNFGSKRQLLILWELDSQKDSGHNYVVSRKYGMSLHQKAEFRKLLESWAGRKVTPEEEQNGFDASTLAGKPCAVQIIHNESNGNTYANVGAVTKLMKGMTALKPENPIVSYSFDDHGKNIPDGTPEWVAKQIKLSAEWQGTNNDGKDYQSFEGESVSAQADIAF